MKLAVGIGHTYVYDEENGRVTHDMIERAGHGFSSNITVVYETSRTHLCRFLSMEFDFDEKMLDLPYDLRLKNTLAAGELSIDGKVTDNDNQKLDNWLLLVRDNISTDKYRGMAEIMLNQLAKRHKIPTGKYRIT